jgi:uncharacterized protein
MTDRPGSGPAAEGRIEGPPAGGPEVRRPFAVVDFHVHLPVPFPAGPARRGVERFLGHLPEEQIARMRAASRVAQERRWAKWGFEPPETDPPPPAVQADRWAAQVERHGLRLAVLVTGGGNDQLASLVAGHPGRLAGFAHHLITDPDAAPELERAVTELGLSGYKIFATALGLRLDDPSLDPVWEVAQRHRLPVLAHFGVGTQGMGMTAGPSASPLVLQNVARSHPDITFVVPHFGAGYLEDLLRVCWACANISVDCSGSNEWMEWMPYPVSRRDLLSRLMETIGPARIIFGTDSSYFPRGFVSAYLDQWLETAAEVGMDESDQAMFFGGNALRLLHLDEAATPEPGVRQTTPPDGGDEEAG